ncbi:MAG TPA: low specificity L-threonine aldolase, partial [Dongiaceae bacterium]
LAAIERANSGAAMPYGNDEITRRLEQRIANIFERSVAVFPVATGTASNALALSALTPPYGVIYCHEQSHIQADECGAPELFTGGAKLLPLAGASGKVTPGALAAALAQGWRGNVHNPQPAVLSLTQATEFGTIYRLDEIRALAEIAHAHGLKVHMDGTRFANALVSLNCAPADATWRAGVDVLSLGATKNGALAAESVIFFDPALAQTMAFRRKRGGHLFSKMRFVSAQLEAYLSDDLWLRNARQANAMARKLADGLAKIHGCRLIHPREANLLFVMLPNRVIDGLEQAGFGFYREGGVRTIRLVTSYNTDPAAVDALVNAAKQLAAGAPVTMTA